MNEICEQKKAFAPGEWNVCSVMLGGLGNPPSINGRSHLSFYWLCLVKIFSDVSMFTLLPLFINNLLKYAMTFSQEGESSNQQQQFVDREAAADSLGLCLQDRLERVWNALGMTDSQKLDMALKYSSEKYAKLLGEVSAHYPQLHVEIQMCTMFLNSWHYRK